MSRGDEAERAAIQMMGQKSRMIDQISELMAAMLENISQKRDQDLKGGNRFDEGMKGSDALNRFAIAEKYNEIGKTRPKEFVKWLLNNLSERYRQMLKEQLNHMLEMFSHYDHAQRASDRKIHMPWDKEGQTVEPEHYIKEKESFYKAEMAGVFKSLGMENEGYMDPETITRAHVLEDYISEMFEKTYRESLDEGKAIDRQNFLEAKQRAINSVDFGVADFGFKFNMPGEDVEVVIRQKADVEKLSKGVGLEGEYPFLLREEAVCKGGTEYYVIDASNEVYRDMVVADMFARDREARQIENAKRAARALNLDSLCRPDGIER